MSASVLMQKLRRRIKDDRPNQRALSLSVSDDSVARAIGEVADSYLSVNVQGGGGLVPSLNIKLSDFRYATIGKLYQVLSRTPGYTAHKDESASDDHPSTEIQPVAPMDIGPGRSAMELRHYTFSDAELVEVLNDAITRHNPSFTEATLPESEEVFVLQLAHAEICRRQAYDSSKRKGLSETVADLLAIANNLEATYQIDVARLTRALVSPKEANPNTMDEGDVVIGTMFRASARTGYHSPLSQNHHPAIPVLIQPDDVRDVEDTNIRFRWERNHDNDLYSTELWIDTQQDVERSGLTNGASDAEANQNITRPTSSKMVFRSYSAGSAYDSSSFKTIFEQYGQGVVACTVGELEPSTEYFARLYMIDRAYEVSASEVVRYKTKALRAQFASSNYASTLVGSSGDTVTLTFDSDYGQVTAAHVLTIGGVAVELTILTPYTATFVVPSFVNKRLLKDLVITSPTGLRDIKPSVFQVQ